MITTTTAAVAAGTAAAQKVIPPFADKVKSIAQALFSEAVDVSTVSLTSFASAARISSRVFIDGSVAQDPVITDIIKTVHTQYCAFILLALQMNQLVSSSKTVQDLLRVVATEDNNPHEDIAAEFVAGLEAKQPSPSQIRRNQTAQNNNPSTSPVPPVQSVKVPLKKNKIDKEPEEDKKSKIKQVDAGVRGAVVNLSGDGHIPSGRLIEVTFANPEKPDHKITVNIYVQLAPYLVPAELAVLFLTKDDSPSFYQRWIQWRTGEISFFKDLILQCDRAKKREQLLKLDPSGATAAMIASQSKSRWKFAANLEKEPQNRARNIANTVLIFNQDTVLRAKAESGFDLNHAADRNSYFAATFALMIIVVDTMYNQATFYYNGIDDASTFSFDQLRTASKNGSSTDLISIMNALNQGKTPKF